MRMLLPARALLLAGAFASTFQMAASAAESGQSEAALVALASAPGPRQAEALQRLGRQPPQDPVAVAKALVAGLVGKDIASQIMAEHAADALLRSSSEPAPLAAPLARHADRLLTAAESRMTELTNAPLVVLGELSLDSGTCASRLVALLAPGRKFRQNTVSALANCRPLTAEIKRAALAEAAGKPLAQQNLAIAMGTWPAADLVGDEVDRALAQLLDSVMGNIPPRVIDLVGKRAQPSPILAAKLLGLVVDPTTDEHLFAATLSGYATCAGEAQDLALRERLLAQDPHLDPERCDAVVATLVDRNELPPALIARLSVLVKDDTLSWWLRHRVAKALSGKPFPADLAAVVEERSKDLEWVIEVQSASGWPPDDVAKSAAKAASDEERTAWTIATLLSKELAAHEGDPDFNRRRGAIQVASVARWAATHPDAAWRSPVVEATLQGFTGNYAPTPDERTQGLVYVTALLQHGFFADAALATTHYPQNAPVVLGHQAFQALAWAVEPERRSDRPNQHDDPLVLARLEAVRRLHAAKAPPILIMNAERELASSIRFHVRESGADPGIYREDLKSCGFSLAPIQAFLEAVGKR